MKTCKFFVLFVAVISAVTAASAQNKAQTIFNLEEAVSKKALSWTFSFKNRKNQPLK